MCSLQRQVASLPPVSAVKVIKTEPSVCVCPSVSTLMAEPFDTRSWNLVQKLTLILSSTSLMVKVMGQRSRSPGQKSDFQDFMLWGNSYQTVIYDFMSWCDVIRHRGMTSWHHRVILLRLVGLREVQQRYSVFVYIVACLIMFMS